ncbi:benzyl alcohol O-benzoyltransferase [Artemisia annua]|uniref:Benzyl alcohol O-benzoyltransferase n=1 Tax=Artemisia annua TaxID=35608 RepID=A0A2U1KEL5_ARTAN|nr:benzyl alcohol O-benzoyltransferase [Artemisia annua]
MQQPNTSLTFLVKKHAPEMITPASPTPRELKHLSDIDDQDGLRLLIPLIQFYRKDPKMGNKNPASVIREALAKVLVFYYPLAGRLKEGPGRKLMVDCAGEGVLFIEAEADVNMKQFGETLHPPFPCLKKLLCYVPGSDSVVGSPLILIQVTHLLCGGFIFTARVNHTMFDAKGMVQFLTALGEIAQGASAPSILPVWQRELLFARDPPCATFTHHEYEEVQDMKEKVHTVDEMMEKSFFFGPNELSALRRFVPDNLKSCSTFDVVTACIWRCRTIALQPNPEDNMRLMFFVDARTKLNPPIPIGYYGNCSVIPFVISKARDLSNKNLDHVLKLVMKAKSIISEEYVRSTTDLMVIKGRPHFNIASTYIISSLTRSGFNDVDFGWGKATFGGPAEEEIIPEVFSYYMPSTNSNGEFGIMVPITLRSLAMENFVKELSIMLMSDAQLKVLKRVY